MYTEADREGLLRQLIARARADPTIESGALVGSAARRSTDRWSDIDLALGLAPGNDVVGTASRWTQAITELATVCDTLDVWSGEALYRVFLLDTSLQLDVSFWPPGALAPTGGQPFELLFGTSAAPHAPAPAALDGVIGWAWLYALHVRSAIARDQPWQAMQMLDGLRGQIIQLSCARYGLDTQHGRGVDRLPEAVRATLADTLAARADVQIVAAAFAAAVRLLSAEVHHVDLALAGRLQGPLDILLATAGPTSA